MTHPEIVMQLSKHGKDSSGHFEEQQANIKIGSARAVMLSPSEAVAVWFERSDVRGLNWP